MYKNGQIPRIDDEYFLNLWITSGPIVIFGTKCPSITSICIKSAPAFSKSRISFPNLLKSADRIDGDILIEGIRKFIFLYLNYVKKKEGREFPPFLNILYKFVLYALAESPISSTRALTDFLGSVDISIL